MASLNSFDFTGNLGRDPELRNLPSGKTVCSFSVAVAMFGDRPTLWVDVSVWGSAAESCAKYLSKGSSVAIHGRVDEVASFQRKDGETGVSLRVSTRDVSFIGTKSESNSQGQEFGAFTARSDVPSSISESVGGAAVTPELDDSIPFAPSVI